MKLSDFIQDIGRPIAYYPALARLLGVKAAIFLGQLIYWTGREASSDGWIFKTTSDIEEETGLSRKEQSHARKRLKELGILHQHYDRLHHRLLFKVDFRGLNALWERRGITEIGNRHLPKGQFGK